MVSATEIYDYIDDIRKNSPIEHVRYIEDICLVVVSYHQCGCRERLYKVDEIMNATDDNDNVYRDIFLEKGLLEGLKLAGAYARLITLRNRYRVVMYDIAAVPKDFKTDIKELIHHIKQSGIMLVNSSKKENPFAEVNWHTLEPLSWYQKQEWETSFTEMLTKDEITARYPLTPEQAFKTNSNN